MMFNEEQYIKFKKYLSQQGKKRQTLDAYTRDIKAFVAYLAEYHMNRLEQLEPYYLVHYQQFLIAKQASQNSMRRSVIGIRQFFRYLVDSGQCPISPFESMPIPPRMEALPECLESTDVDALFEATQTSQNQLKSFRDRSIVALLVYEGLKVTELIQLELDDFLIHNDIGSLRITGPRHRVLTLSGQTTKILVKYTEVLKTHFANHLEKMIFAFKGKDYHTVVGHMSRHGLKFLLYELGHKAGIDKLNTEHLRHYAMRSKLEDGINPMDLMQHFGLRRLGNIAKHLTHVRM